MKNLLLLGMLSKSIGQIIRVMHVLFHLEREDPLPNVISNEALDAAINFVDYWKAELGAAVTVTGVAFAILVALTVCQSVVRIS